MGISKKTVGQIVGGALAATAISVGAIVAPMNQSDINGLKVHYIDVGQGDSILIQQGKYNMLIDAGDNSKGEIVKAYLKKENVKKLDVVIGTHVHEDHIGGMDDVVKALDVSKIYFPKNTSTTATFTSFVNAAANKNLKFTVGKMGENFSFGEAKASILSPISDTYSNANNYSIVLKMVYGQTSFLFMGDAEKLNEKEILNAKEDVSANVIKIGHHGSNTSSSEEFIKAVNPTYGVISVGENNTYGHPNKEIIDLLNKQNIKILRTDQNGSIVITSDGKSLSVSREK